MILPFTQKTAVILMISAAFAGMTGCRSVPFRTSGVKESQALALNREGIAAFERDQLDEASEKFTQAIKNNENDLASRRYYAEILWRNEKRNEAIHALIDAAARDGSEEEKIEIYESLADKFLMINQPLAALNYADKVINTVPKRHEGWELRAAIERQIGKKEEALADYHKALHSAPNDQDLLRALASLESEMGDDQGALAVWEALGRFYPDHSEPADILCGKALACQKLGRKHDAAEYYASAVQREPDNARLYALLADAYLENHDENAAKIVAVKAAERFPSDPEMRSLPQRVEAVGMNMNSTRSEWRH